MLPPLRALVVFEAVARLRSVSLAAKELNVTQAAISQQLKQLESFLDTQLLERGRSGMTLTHAGQKYHPVVSYTLGQLKKKTQSLFGEEKSEVLRMRVNNSLAQQWLLPRLKSFYRQYPFIRIDIDTVDWPSRNPCDTVDVEITNGRYGGSDIQTERLFNEQWHLVCSPKYYEKHKEKLVRFELNDLDAIQVKGYEDDWYSWLHFHGLTSAPPRVILEVNNSLQAMQAAKHDIGLLMVRSLVAMDMLEKGELVIAMPGEMPEERGHYLITQSKRPPKVQLFCDWLYAQMSHSKPDLEVMLQH
ncbi:LysR family transcriptional regulator [Photobacterium sanctipauli]|uniref:LysR family transcriptional regulator n=1 Tax=Photobacterium sanctipauli TaxID=1342794 RepID=A0A2T3NUE4_9GAMM|nr:LysR substrate-binding domain-containing protein [Photobacterium sanctipauli]PSW19861.1 LysR family transcriptional regulator [Photobacterium sanctipauli]